MNHPKLFIPAFALLIIASAFVFTRPPTSENPQNPDVVSNTDDTEVRQAVMNFGTKLADVSLLASTSARTAAMNAAYGEYVAPELLTKWYPEGAEALGRYTSSPWPDSIDVVEVKKEGELYVVEANILEVALSQEGKMPAAVRPVTLTLEKRGNKWMIIDMKKGAYGELPQRRTIVGYWECLPVKNPNEPHTLECAFGIAVDQSDGHFAVNTQLMSQSPVDFPTGTKVRVTGVVTPVEALSSIQKYDIDGIISATTIEKVQ
jgi:hypothetical protein